MYKTFLNYPKNFYVRPLLVVGFFVIGSQCFSMVEPGDARSENQTTAEVTDRK